MPLNFGVAAGADFWSIMLIFLVPYLYKAASRAKSYTSDIYYHGVDTTSSSFKKGQCDYPDPPE